MISLCYRMSSWDVGRLEVAFGMHELKPSHQSSTPLVKVKVRKVTRHRGFNSRTLVITIYNRSLNPNSIVNCLIMQYNDIAIITLDTPIDYSSFASPVCLPKGNDDAFDKKEAVVIGWGSLKEGIDFWQLHAQQLPKSIESSLALNKVLVSPIHLIARTVRETVYDQII